MKVTHASHASVGVSTRSRAWVRLLSFATTACCCCVGLFACHFDSQPLFEPFESDGTASMRRIDFPGLSSAAADADDAGEPADVSGTDAGVGSMCVPHEVLGCEQSQLLTCSADGAAVLRAPCGDAGCSAAADRCNDCLPGSLSCRGEQLVRCDGAGRVADEHHCELGCLSPPSGAAACRVCADGAAMCRDGDLLQCAAGGLGWETTPCERGCDAAAKRCRVRLVPANLPQDACMAGDVVERERIIEGDVTWDLDRECPRVISQGRDAPELCVYAFERLRIAAGARLRATGSRGLVLLASVSMAIEGRISVSAKAASAGPGSLQSGPGLGQNAVGRVPEGIDTGMWTNLPANAGGGGGGHVTAGAPGGDGPGQCGSNGRCAEGGAGGAAYGAETLAPLLGGANGGTNSAAEWSTRRGEPGGGGGALQLVGCGTLELGSRAVIDANGGGGEGGFPGSSEMDSETPGAGAGGGSGGAILLQAVKLSAEPGALLVANGGGGGGGATRTGEGPDPRQAGEPGQDGQLGAVPAHGGSGAGESFAGGAGGATDPPVAGGRTRQRSQAAGGGGGAAGRIRIESQAGDPPMLGVVVSPQATYGTVTVE